MAGTRPAGGRRIRARRHVGAVPAGLVGAAWVEVTSSTGSTLPATVGDEEITGTVTLADGSHTPARVWQRRPAGARAQVRR